MSYLKDEAMRRLNELHQGNHIDFADYSAIFEALDEIEPLRDRDEILEELWAQLEDVPFDPETETIEAPFMGWGSGISRDEIWHWFDARHSKGVAYLLYNDGVDRTPETARLLYHKQLCKDCGCDDCVYCHDGECRFALVHEQSPKITEENGCSEYCPKI